MKSSRLSRRTMLRGAGGIAVGLPLLEAMLPRRAHAAGPKRFVLFFTPNGTNDARQFMPQGAGTAFTLGTETAPLMAVKDKMMILSGINHNTFRQQEGGDRHAIGMGHLLTCVKTAKGPSVDDISDWGGGISIDQKIAQAIGSQTRFPSLEIGVQTTLGTLGTGVHPFSRMIYKSSALAVPAVEDPREVYKRIFADLPATSTPTPTQMPVLDKAMVQRKSVLDFVRQEYTTLGTKLNPKDRQKLELHTTAIREIETRLSTPIVVTAGCKKPSEPSATLNVRDPSQYPAIGKLQMDLLATALACDLSRVASLQWSWARSDVAMSWIGVRDSHHEMSHGKASPTLSTINKWYAEQVVHFVNTLAAYGEGGTTVLDNSVVWWCSEVSDGPSHSETNMRVFLFGTCGGFFNKPGQHIAMTNASISQLMVSFMRAMGLPDNQFGDPAGGTGPLAGFGT